MTLPKTWEKFGIRDGLTYVAVTEYGSEGLKPLNLTECPYAKNEFDDQSCISASGGSMCGGYMGGMEIDGVVYVFCQESRNSS